MSGFSTLLTPSLATTQKYYPAVFTNKSPAGNSPRFALVKTIKIRWDFFPALLCLRKCIFLAKGGGKVMQLGIQLAKFGKPNFFQAMNVRCSDFEPKPTISNSFKK